MTTETRDAASGQLSLTEELILMLLNEESGYFHQVPGWSLNCSVVGAALAELSLSGRIDTELESLILLDSTPTGDPTLDPALEAISAESDSHDAQFWVERLAPQAESIIDHTLERLAEQGVLQHHDGDYWSLGQMAWRFDRQGETSGTATEFVKSRIARVIFNNEIPDPHDVIIISLLDTCDVLRFIFQLEPPDEKRIELVRNLELICRSFSAAVAQNLASPLVRRSGLKRDIPAARLMRMVRNRHARQGNLPALFADMYREYGPVFDVRPPFQRPMTILAGPEVNRWAQREGRLHLTSTKYLDGLEQVYGAHGIIPALDSSNHFRIRKAIRPSYSRARLEDQIHALYGYVRGHMAEWNVGDTFRARSMSRLLTNAQISPIVVSIESQDIVEDLIEYKERALNTRVANVMPKFLLHTPAMRRASKSIDIMIERIERSHTATQRAGCPRDIIDDFLSLHAGEPQLLPESSLKFSLSAPLLASMYLGDGLGFALFSMATQPELYERIRAEAEEIFADGDPESDVFQGPRIDVTRRFVMECLRMYPVVPGSLRDVMNSCTVADYELPLGARVLIMQTASHYLEEIFPNPHTFDIDRYLPEREEHRSTAYAPFGLGTHTCLGQRWVELQMAVNLLMVAYYFDIEVRPANAKLRISPFPSLSISNRLKFHIAAQRREIPPPSAMPADATAGEAPAIGCPVAH